MVFGCCEAGNGHGFRFYKVNRCLMRGLPMDNPRTNLELLKTVRIACWISMVHVKLTVCMLLFELNDLKCV